MFRSNSLPTAVAVAALAAAALAAAPSSSDTTTDSNVVHVQGSLDASLGTTSIGTDDLGDATVPNYGVDVVGYSVSFPDATTIAFGLEIGDPIPVLGHAPAAAQYEINPTVGDTSVTLTAQANPDTGLELGAETCTPDPNTGVGTCSTEPVLGGYEDGVITWLYPVDALGGATITGGAVEVNPTVTTGNTGGILFNGGLYDTASSTLALVPSADLILDGEVVATGRLSDAGYDVASPPMPAGDYAAQLRLCNAVDGDFDGTADECSTLDLGTVTVG